MYVKEKKLHRGYAGFPTLFVTRFGHESPPLMFWSYPKIAALLGMNYTVMWGIAMHFVTWESNNTPLYMQFFASLFAGAMFGAGMAYFYKREHQKLGIRDWDTLVEEYNPPERKAS
jgi:hypothetical protein